MGSYSQKISKLIKNDNFGDLLPVVEYMQDENIFLLEEPAIGSMIICQPSNGTHHEIQNALNTIYRSSYPDDTTLQAQIVCTPDIEDSLFGYRAIRGGRMQNIDEEKCEALSKSIHDFYRLGTTSPINNTGFQFRNIEFWFTIKIPIKGTLPTDDEVNKLKEITSLTYTRLNMFSPSMADERAYYRRMKVLLNMYDTEGWRNKAVHEDKEFRTYPLKQLILQPGKRVEVEKDGIGIYNNDDEQKLFIKTGTILELPENLVHGFMLNLMGDWQHGSEGLFEPFILSLNIIVPNQEKAKSAFTRRRAFITNQAQGPLLKFVDKLGFQKADYDVVDREITQENSSILNYSLQVVTFSKNKTRANAFMKKLQGFYSRQSIKLVPDNHFVLPFFLANLPFGLHNLYQQYAGRFNTATSKMMTYITPYMGSWKGNTAYPNMMLTSRLGQVVNLDTFVSQTNMNIYLAATSGAGKSFMASYLVSCMLGSGIYKHRNPDKPVELPDDGSQVFIVDVGGSYEGLTEQYVDAKYLVFGNSLKYSMNPFPNIIDIHGKDGEANMIRSILKAMAAPSGKVTDLQNAELLSVISDVWDAKGQKATITDVAKLCLVHPEPEMQRFGKQLKPFTDSGVYASFFSDENPPVDYNSRLIVCELEELKNDPHLQVVVLMSLVISIQKQMYMTGTDRRKMFIVDEGWQYLKEEGSEAAVLRFFAEFLETGWRRFRKVNGSGCLITQSVMDAYESSVGKAIIANSAWLMLMRQENEAIDKLESEKMYSGSKSDFGMLRSLRTQKPKPGVSDEAFSEIYIRYEGASQVCRLYTDRRFQLMQTTTPEEKAIRQRYIDKGMSLQESVEQMLIDEGVS
jgi:conjugal transfer ATP-binding protein TraC